MSYREKLDMIDIEDIKPYERMVYYYETDRMGIVHHSNYIRWMEEARMDWMKQIGWDYKTIEDDNIIIPVLSAEAEYKTMSRYGDTVSIKVTLSEYTGVRIGFSYDICDKETGELRCVGKTSHCLLDENNKLLFVRKAYPERDKFFKSLVGKA
jgi:acyl-CoA thioester hydrolase